MINFSLPSVTLAVSNTNKIKKLEDAYDYFVNNKKCDAAKFKLEVAFWKCYGKKASSELIERLAKIHWGQLRSWNVFGYSSPRVIGCNYDNHKTNISRVTNYPVLWNLFVCASALLSFFLGAFLFFAGLSMLTWHIVRVMSTPLNEIMDAWLSIFSWTFCIGTLGPFITIFGAWAVRTSIKMIVASEHDFQAKQLHNLIEELG